MKKNIGTVEVGAPEGWYLYESIDLLKKEYPTAISYRDCYFYSHNLLEFTEVIIELTPAPARQWAVRRQWKQRNRKLWRKNQE